MKYNLLTNKGRKLFYSSTKWIKLSQLKRVNNPLCEICLEKGLLTPSIDIHHIVDIKDNPSLALDYDNLQALCKECHSKITTDKQRKDTKKQFYNISKWDY